MGVGWRVAAVAGVVVLGLATVDALTTRDSGTAPPAEAAAQVTLGATSAPPAATASPTPTGSIPVLPPLKPGATPKPPAGSRPAAPPAGYPNAANTGVPAGVALQTVNGDYKTSRGGQVVSGLNITGTLVVQNEGVTVRNVRASQGVVTRGGSGGGLTIEDSDIGPATCPGNVGGANPNDFPLVDHAGGYTLRRVHLRGDEDLVRTSAGRVLVQDSFLDHTCMYAGAHSDAVQQYSPGDVSNVTLIHNTIDGRTANSAEKGNSAVFWSDHPAAGSTLTAYANLFAGGNFAVWTTDAPAGSGVVIDIHDNQFVRGSYQYGPHNCANAVPFNGREGVKWSNNTFSDNRQQIKTDC
jgi:hypothetical protein